MGLAETFKNAALAAHKAVGNVVEAVTYHSRGTMTYNPATGANAESDGTDYSLARPVFANYESGEIDGKTIQKNDVKMLVPGLDVSFTPKTDDYVTRADATVWKVVDWQLDPAGAEWVFQLRK